MSEKMIHCWHAILYERQKRGILYILFGLRAMRFAESDEFVTTEKQANFIQVEDTDSGTNLFSAGIKRKRIKLKI